jgi:surface polysaccharide O-acyltransferase-like enzyme
VEKRQDIELLRIFSAFGIVWFHSPITIGKHIAYSGLIIFLIISTYFSSHPYKKIKSFSDKARRLLVPWLLWFLFYGLINIMLGKAFIDTNKSIIEGILSGTKIHLWFMPFIFMAVIFFDFIKKYIKKDYMNLICTFFIVTILFTSDIWKPYTAKLGSPWWQYANALVGLFIGVILANISTLTNQRKLNVAILCILALSIIMFLYSVIDISYFIAIVITTIVILKKQDFFLTVKVTWLSKATLGIYFLHPFFLGAIKQLCGSELGFYLPFVVFSLSVLTTLFLQKFTPNLAKYIV